MGWIGVETNGGAALLAQWAAGSETLYVLGATVGSGYVAEANMRTATALQHEEAEASIIETVHIENGIKVRVRVGPAEEDGYTGHEIGIWAKLGQNGTRTLIQLHQDSTIGIEVPSVSVTPEFVFDLICPMVVSNNGSLSVSIDTSVYVSNGQMERHVKEERLMMDNIPGTTVTPTLDASGDVTKITHVETVSGDILREDTFTKTTTIVTEVRTLSTGEVLTIETNRNTRVSTYTFS